MTAIALRSTVRVVALLTLIAAMLAAHAVPGVASTACSGPHAVAIDTVLARSGSNIGLPSQVTVSLAAPLAPGEYRVTLVSYDDHNAKPEQIYQTNEQWFVRLVGGGYQSPPISDLPVGQEWLTETVDSSALLTGTATALQAVHADLGPGLDVDSVTAVCAVVEPVTPPDPGTASIGDLVWADANANGLQDAGEAGLEGVTVALSGNGVTATATTGANGFYLFDGLAGGSYDVAVGPGPAGSTLTTAAAINVSLAPAQAYVDADFGFQLPPLEPKQPQPQPSAMIGDTVWLDSNGNGYMDGAEEGIAGVSVTLTDLGGGAPMTLVTDGGGHYHFVALAAGSYRVTVGAGPAGTSLTTPGSVDVTLAAGQAYLDADFGFDGTEVLGGTITPRSTGSTNAPILPATGLDRTDVGVAGLAALAGGIVLVTVTRRRVED